MKGLVIAAVVCIGIAVIMGGGCSTLNREASIRTQILAKQKANTSEFDKMKKTLSSVAGTAQFQFDKLQEIFVQHAQARGGDGKNAIFKFVHESIPNIDTVTLQKVIDAIERHRSEWNRHQVALVDFEREHRLMFLQYPDALWLSVFGRKPLEDVVLVTSSATKEAFATGEDNETDLFPKAADQKRAVEK